MSDYLSKAGYNVEQTPTVSGPKNPDYRIEGKIFDCYAPTNAKPGQITSRLREKVKLGQADRFVLNLDDTEVSLADIQANLTQYPPTEIQEIIFVRGGTIIYHWP
ncbi:CdiA C-terminal domain-containing protein [Microcoleus sp. AT3-D2]|uniref:CdiA C-terminal domain-containing protein n=1 Tax=Microcoleus sp. AT3-D2 TaxID=2818612 RepID=UPI002FD249F2